MPCKNTSPSSGCCGRLPSDRWVTEQLTGPEQSTVLSTCSASFPRSQVNTLNGLQINHTWTNALHCWQRTAHPLRGWVGASGSPAAKRNLERPRAGDGWMGVVKPGRWGKWQVAGFCFWCKKVWIDDLAPWHNPHRWDVCQRLTNSTSTALFSILLSFSPSYRGTGNINSRLLGDVSHTHLRAWTHRLKLVW